MDSLRICDLPIIERPRERLERLGPEALRAEELLAIVLRTGYRGRSAVDLARELLVQTPLAELLRSPLARLRQIKGVGLSRAAAVVAMAELVRRTQSDAQAGFTRIRSTDDIIAQSIEIREKKKEYLLAFFLNARHQLIAKEVISIGTLTASLAHPREIFAPAIGKAAAALILVHNHPSGDPSPSEEDARLTQRIAQAGRIMGIDLLDHLIVAESGSYSFKNSGGL